MNEGGTSFFLRLDLYASLESVFQGHHLLESTAAFGEVIGLESFETTGMSFPASEGAAKAWMMKGRKEGKECGRNSQKELALLEGQWGLYSS